MGRPLKIAKAQAVLTITGTAATGNLVTVTETLSQPTNGVTSSSGEGILSGMPFVVATNIGNLLAGTIYYVLKVVSANTFTVSATALSANPNSTPFALANTSAQSVKATVAFTDAYFNNPNTNGSTGYPAASTTTYSVVGGNTSIYGKQVLANVAIGQAATGKIATASTSNLVYASVDPFTEISAGSVIQANVPNVNGSTNDLVTIGFVASVNSEKVLAITSTKATGNYLVTSGNAQTLTSGVVWFNANIGGNIVANTPYYLGTVTNATHFTVLYNPAGANVPVTTGNVAAANLYQHTAVLTANATTTYSTPVNFVYAKSEAGFIVRQKGKQKYLVTGATSGLTAQCYLANLANTALLPNTMTITGTYANSGTVKIQSLSDHNLGSFTTSSSPSALANIVSPGQPTGTLGYINSSPGFATFNSAFGPVIAGAFVTGSSYTIVSVGNTDFTLIGAASNTVGVSFVATGAGTGTGTASLQGIPYPILTIGNA